MNKFVPFFLCVTFWSCYDEKYNERQIISSFESKLGIGSSYQLQEAKFKNNQSLIYAKITDEQRQMLTDSFLFITADSFARAWKNKGFIHYELANLYFLDTSFLYSYRNNYDQYAYYIIGLAKQANNLVYMECFPEIPPGI